MKSKPIKRLITITLLGGALIACAPVQPATTSAGTSGGSSTASTPEATAPEATAAATTEAAEGQPTTAPDRAAVVPVDAAECEAIQTAISDRLGVEFTTEEAGFSNETSGLHGTACTLTATGTGEDFGNFVDTAQSIRDVLAAEGWAENTSYLADGPTGTASGYELDNQLAIVRVDWEPAEGVDCPDDQPISACEVEPSEQNFTVVVELVQLG